MAKYSTVRSLLKLANAHDLEVHQLDVKTAFLDGSVEHDIYMSQPDSFIDPNRPNYVCKLNKRIYGLKQSARCWNSTSDEFLTSSGYQRSAADECIYIKQIKNSLPVSNDTDFLNAEKKSLCDSFEMTDQGKVHYILEMSIKRDRQNHTMYISQQNYVKGILRHFGMEDCNSISTPMENCVKFHKLSDEDEPFNTHIYHWLSYLLIHSYSS